MKFTEKDINNIMDNFDFNKVHKCMIALDWQWYSLDGVPSIYNLKQQARNMLERVVNRPEKKYYLSTGGFTVEKRKKLLELRFEVASIDIDRFDE